VPVAPALLALAGGIGQTRYESIRSFHYGDAAAQIIIVAATVIAIDLISARIRKALI
jgi:phosphonate transport system permease protein